MDERRAYVAICTCGNLLAVATDEPHNADAVADWIREGFSVERKTRDEFTALPWGHAEGCPKKKSEQGNLFEE